MYPTLADSPWDRRINPWYDPNEAKPRRRTTAPSTPAPKAHPILMAARARRARRLRQQARVEASQEATA